MTVAKDKKRVMVTLSEKDYKKVEELAEKDKRTISNMVAKLITDQLEKLEK